MPVQNLLTGHTLADFNHLLAAVDVESGDMAIALGILDLKDIGQPIIDRMAVTLLYHLMQAVIVTPPERIESGMRGNAPAFGFSIGRYAKWCAIGVRAVRGAAHRVVRAAVKWLWELRALAQNHTLTRNTGGIGNQIWIEIYALIGATSRTITASYTNQDGVSGRTTKPALIGATGYREAQRLIMLPLQDGDIGVQAIDSVTLSASTGTAGNFGVVIAKPLGLGLIPGAGTGYWRDYLTGLPGLPKIDTNACLAFAFMANSTAAPQIMFAAGFAER